MRRLPVIDDKLALTIDADGITAWHGLLVQLGLAPCFLAEHHCATCSMSAYMTCQTEFRDVTSLVAALKDLGYQPEVHAEPAALYGYEGDMRPERAHVIVRRGQVGLAANDLGFVRQADGSYGMLRSQYDSQATFPDARAGQLKARYGYHQVITQAKKRGYTVASETTAQGKIKIVLRRFS